MTSPAELCAGPAQEGVTPVPVPKLSLAARRLLPAMARGLMRDVPQLVELGCDAQELLRRLYAGIELPGGLEWVEPEAAGAA